MPDIDEIERIRSNPRIRLMPVVILTSSSEDKDVTASNQHGTDSYVRQTIDFDQFTRLASQVADYWLELGQTAPLSRGSHI
jgi:two-component system, response regulator